MLTVGDLKDNLIFFHILSRLNLLPIQVNVKEGTYKVLPKECKIRWGMWLLSFVIGLAQLGFNATRLVQVLVYREKYLNYTHLPLHIFVLGILSALCSFAILSFASFPQVTAQLFNEMRCLKGKDKKLKEEDKDKREACNKKEYQNQPILYQKFMQCLLWIPYMIQTLKKYKNRPVVEPLVIVFPYIWCIILLSYATVYVYDPTFEHFTVSIFIKNREEFLCQPLLWLLFLVDFWVTTFWASNALTPITMIIFFQNCIFKFEENCQRVKRCKLEESAEAVSLIYKEARATQVLVQNFNRGFAWKLFFLKNVYFMASTLMFTFSIYMIQLEGQNPGLIAFYLLIGAAVAISFGIGCQNAFKVFALAGKLKKELIHLTELANLQSFHWAKLYKRRAWALRPLPIRIGNFNSMERGSTLIFIYFIFTKTFELLVAIR